MQKNVTLGRRKGCPNYSPEFKHQLVAAFCEPGISISKLALENDINANVLFKWRRQWHEGKLLLPSTDLPQLLPVTLNASAGPLAVQSELPTEEPETLNVTCEVAFRLGTIRLLKSWSLMWWTMWSCCLPSPQQAGQFRYNYSASRFPQCCKYRSRRLCSVFPRCNG
ncbi:transposase [Klebsiella oxytoca]|jgi:transposase|uniref:transposase n=1 Tax=Klebsiella oxytoca TaxID=571 RepID=UPI00024FF141|nr:transposase [Klebsiella oxytoca]EHS88840.1 hypothetical protein HMPREF9687_05202 [Klebsiella oxytoca 10-5243]